MSTHTAAPRRAPATVALAWLTCAVLALTGTACGSGDGGAPVRSPVQDLVSRGTVPGAAKLSQDAHGVAGFRTAGVADVRTGRRIGLTDRFRVGSITKTVVATVVLQLVAEHRLGLDDPAAGHLPARTAALLRGNGENGHERGPASVGDTARNADKSGITVRQLLDHTSGLFSYTDDRAFHRDFFGTGFAAHRFESHDPGALVRTALAHPPYAPPGTRYRYSNTDYLLLGMVIRQVTGHSYATEARRRVIEPLRLTGTSFPGTRTGLPTPHGRAYTGSRDVTELNPSAAGAAGEMISTLPDLNRLFGALLRGELLPARELRLMRDTTASRGRYGMGLYPVRLPCRRTVWGHDGVINGSYVRVLGTADGGRVVSYRVNGDAGVPAGGERRLVRAEFCAGR
ncbi:beta-lactamase family protein [Streptomyces sp. HU2014]|uniref:serine hydrolase domain-containing protein n=1 Tax=Streptomyces sp. HU2014 TaxID=2939414 RepID=UPI002010C545|nr:serine hydrolase domain-containing protein [Streptomyces sp. HU2014]UQI43150.1 beta-lactamase family protein [Streptomyces sp. HU2014]